MDRRRFLQGLGASLGFASLGIGRVAFARAPTDRRLVVVLLRGGLDGLHAVPPLADPDYRSARGPIALPDDAGIADLDGAFGLHPALAGLLPMWDRGELGFVHAVGVPYRGRSHFDGQDVLENGTDQPHGRNDGWLNRALGSLGDGAPPTVAIGAALPLILRGDADASSVDPLREALSGDDFLDQVAEMYRDDAILGPALDRALDTRDLVEHEDAEGPPGRRGRRPSPGRLASATGRLLAAEDGPRIAVLEVGGWDTHQGQGLGSGGLANKLQGLADGLLALESSLGDAWAKTAIVAVSEFGRTVRGNGTGGTDHGTGGLLWLAGGAVAGGRVHGTWPGLGAAALVDGRDLQPTTDVRAVFAGVLRDHLGLDEAALAERVFPGTADLAALALIRG